MANRREKNDDVADPAIGSFLVLWIIGEGEKGGAAVHQHRRRTQQRRTHFWKQRTKMSCVSASAATCRVAPAVRGQRFNKRVATVAPRAHNRRALAIQAAVDLNGARPDARLCSFWIPIGRGIGLRDRRAPSVAARASRCALRARDPARRVVAEEHSIAPFFTPFSRRPELAALARIRASLRVRPLAPHATPLLRRTKSSDPPRPPPLLTQTAVTVADTKRKFVESYPFPIPSIWSVAVNELLVNQHFVRYSTKYSYSKLSSLGFVSVYDQLFEGFPSDEEKAKIFDCFVEALDEDPEKCRKDAAELAKLAKEAGGVDALLASPVLADIKSKGEANEFAYSRYDAIGLFRMLELGGATEPAALEKLADAAGLQLKKVNGDLSMYKGLLSKLAAAKELQKEIFEREKRKTAERLAKKEAANDATA